MRRAVSVVLAASMLVTANPFMIVEHGLPLTPPIPFDRSWLFGDEVQKFKLDQLPQSLSIPTFVRVYDYANDNTNALSLEELGRTARAIVDQDLPNHGAVLFRNLDNRIQSPQDFTRFWNGCCEEWKPATYVPFGADRPKLEGVDLATNIKAENALPCHNEMCYNPRPPSRIAFYCLHDAKEGGETLVVRNTDMTALIDPKIKALIQESGGLLYTRQYRDGTREDDKNPLPGMTWQEKCGTQDRDEAIRYFVDLGFKRDDITFDDTDGTMRVRFLHSGFIREAGEDLWFNIMETGLPKRADGSDYPEEVVAQIQLDRWIPAHAFKLLPGDWLVLDNRVVQHGRLPYKEDPEGPPRTLLTVYTE